MLPEKVGKPWKNLEAYVAVGFAYLSIVGFAYTAILFGGVM
ncbi:MAG: hypothetical protein ACP5GY_09715 [Vulcanisaeta sp.]